MFKRNWIAKYLVLIFPLVFLLAGLNFNHGRYANDPDYIYLMNALCILQGESVGHIDNPGITVMQTGAATIAIMHLFSNPDDESLVNNVIREPDKFIVGIRKAFTILNSLILILIGLAALKKTKSLFLLK